MATTSSQKHTPLALLGMALLWLLVLASALAVVSTTHQGRQHFTQLEGLRREAGQLQVEWGRYLLEQSAWASYSRIERLALNDLDMQVPGPQQTVMVQQ